MMNPGRRLLAVAALMVVSLAGCESGPGESLPDGQFSSSCAMRPQIHVRAYHCWGETLPDVDRSRPLDWVVEDDSRFSLELSSEGYESASLQISWTGKAEAGALNVESDGTDVAVAFYTEDRDGESCPAYDVAVGLGHPWFACTGRAPSRNVVELFTTGKAMYQSLDSDLRAATQRIHGSTWWWQSDFELTRPDNHLTLSQEERRPQTVMSVLEGRPGVVKRILVARFTPNTATGMAYVNTDPALRAHARTPGDNFEMMSQGNPTPVPLLSAFVPVTHPRSFVRLLLDNNPELGSRNFVPVTEDLSAALEVTVEGGSWHQKAWAIDGKVAYISGMNVKSTDWDHEEHEVFDPFRMKFASSAEERAAVLEHRSLPDLGPRKDYGLRVQGPAVRDVDDILKARWDLGRMQGELFHEGTSAFELLEPPQPPSGSVWMQVQATHPEPLGERSILESTEKAIRRARDIIYIEDQYFRMPIVLDAFEEALAANPDLRVVVVTKPVSISDGAKKWSVFMDQELRAMAGDRYVLLTLGSYGVGILDEERHESPVFVDIDIHAKILIVDDEYLSTGSCNKNDRGLLLEGEMNAAVLDQAFVREARQRVFGIATGHPEMDWNRPGKDIFDDFVAISRRNEARKVLAEDTGVPLEDLPEGFLYPLVLTTDYLLDVGPSMF